eukprot:7391771-Pyramimonas_sp.AAC.1
MGTDCKGLYDALVTNVSAGLGADDRRSGTGASGLRQSAASSQATMRRIRGHARRRSRQGRR